MFQSSDTPIVPLEKVEALRRTIADLFIITDTTLDEPKAGYVRFRGRFIVDPEDCFDELRDRFEQFGFTPMIREDEDRIALIGIPGVFNPPDSRRSINLILLLVTIASTLFAGALYETGSLTGALQLQNGIPFSVSIMLILGAHELGHYFAARYHGVPVTLPYFIPMPISLIGTLGAFIRLKAPVKNKRALLDVGMAGPWAGLIFAVPILLYGLATSEIGPVVAGAGVEGNSLLYALLKIIVFGRILPDGAQDVYLNQFAWAGWVGLLVTGLNLMPVGQLDGGHVSYVLFGKKAKWFFWPVIGALGILTLISALRGEAVNWVVWILLLFFFGRVHAEPLDDVTPLDSRRRMIAIATLLLFVLVFVPVPFRISG